MKSAEEFEGELYKLSYGAVACRIDMIRDRDREMLYAFANFYKTALEDNAKIGKTAMALGMKLIVDGFLRDLKAQ